MYSGNRKKRCFDLLILAGGRGSRLRSVLTDLPKPLANVNGKPFLDYVINFYSKSDLIRNIYISAGYLSESIVATYDGQSYNNKSVSVVVENEPLGTGGAIKHALKFIKSGGVIVVNGDSYVDYDIHDFVDYYLSNLPDILILSNEVEDVSRFGEIYVDKGRVFAFREKQNVKKKGLINSGVYLLDKKGMSFENSCDRFSFEDFLNKNVENLNIGSFATSGAFIDIGVPDSLIEAQYFFEKKEDEDEFY